MTKDKSLRANAMTWKEDTIIQAIRRIFPERPDILERGIGDDCALLRSSYDLVTSDASVEAVHFSLELMNFADAAYRCLSANLSDMAAMGAEAGAFSLVLGLRPELESTTVLSAIEALKLCIDDHQLTKTWLVGGDVVRTATAFFSITLLGKRPVWPLIYRKGAKIGDVILHVGEMGQSAAALSLLKAKLVTAHKGAGAHWKKEASWGKWAPLIESFCRPRALSHLGPALARTGFVHAMMDSSDGLMLDLPRLLAESKCGAIVDLEQLNPDPLLIEAAQCMDLNARDWMLSGGEDFGLIVALDPLYLDRVFDMAYDFGLPCHLIGRCTEGSSLEWREGDARVVPNDRSFYHA